MPDWLRVVIAVLVLILFALVAGFVFIGYMVVKWIKLGRRQI